MGDKILLLRQSCSDRPIFDLIIGVGEKSMGSRRSSSGTSPRPWTPGGMSPQCASSFHYLSLASALGGDTFPHRPPSNFTGAPAGRTAASFASRPNVCQPPRVIIVRPARLYCGLVYASTVEDICARGCCSFSHAGIGSHIVPIHAKLSLCTKLAPPPFPLEKCRARVLRVP